MGRTTGLLMRGLLPHALLGKKIATQSQGAPAYVCKKDISLDRATYIEIPFLFCTPWGN